MSNIEYQVEKGRIITNHGLPYTPRWFCDGRLAFQVNNEGIADINYFGANSDKYIVFHSRFWSGMQFYIMDTDGRSMVRPQKCEVMPFGYRSDGLRCNYGIYVAKETIFIVIEPKTESDFAIEFYDDYLFYPEVREHRDVRYGGAPRKWSEFVFEDNRLNVTYTSGTKKTNIAFTANTEISYAKRARNGKHILLAEKLKAGEEYVFAINFSNEENSDYHGYKEAIAAQYERYEAVAKKAPVLRSKHDKLNQFFELAPMYHESLKTTDVKGAIRAQSTHYWVWGWDSMTSNNCSFYWGDHAFIGEMLDFMEKYSDGTGIAHAFGQDMSNGGAAAAPAQGMYLCIMDLYRLSGGDISAHYPFAKKLFEMILSTEADGTGFCKGTSLYPDFRNLIKETGNDISTFNNTVSYCSVCSMEKIAASMGDTETETKAREFAKRMDENFSKIMFNKELGFIDSSVEATTYEQRGVASNNAVKWENNYCDKLVADVAERCLAFYEKNFVTKAGLRPLPEWSDCYDADSNQLHCWWPVMSEFYTRLINRFDRPELVEQYIGWVEYWSERLMCPEGISCYCNEREVPFDNWNAMPGIWHGYSIRGFYNSVVHAYIGVDFDEKGMNFYPYSGEEVSIENLHWGERTFDIAMKGSGKIIENVVLNGKSLGSVTTIPYEMLQERNEIEVLRTVKEDGEISV